MRLLAIAFGIMSAIALARDGLGFRLMPWLNGVVDAYGLMFDDIFLDVVLFLFEPLFALLRTWFDWKWSLYPHWKHVFVLLWLIGSSDARAWSPLWLLKSSIADRAFWVVRQVVLTWGATVFTALLGGTLAGVVPPGHPSVMWWAMTAFFLNQLLQIFVFSYYNPRRHTRVRSAIAVATMTPFIALALSVVELPEGANNRVLLWAPVAAYFLKEAIFGFLFNVGMGRLALCALEACIATISFVMTLGVVGEPGWLLLDGTLSPSLASLSIFLTISAAWSVLYASVEPAGRSPRLWWIFVSSSRSRAGVDVLSVLGGAAFLVWLSTALA